MKALIPTLFAVIVGNNLNLQAAETGWIKLFDGKTLDGWKAATDKGGFAVAGNTIAAGGTEMNHLFYVGPVRGGRFKNFELKVEVKTTPGSNSGIFFHTRSQPGFLLKGYEAQINATHKDRRKTGSLLNVDEVEDVTRSPAKDGEWFEYRILVNRKRIVLKVDGNTTVDYTEPAKPQRAKKREQRILSNGSIALQGHDPDSKVYFRNIFIRPLPD